MLVQRFKDNINSQQLFTKKEPLIIAVSGGLDSTVLCELCRQVGYDFSIAHCNFQLRGKESERDEDFVKNVAARYQAAFHLRRFDTEAYAEAQKLSIQEAARELRYDWFRQLVKESGSALLLTAHHRDDNIETVLMNFLRGTGLHGLTGIPARNDYIRRPLLPFSRQELKEFQEEHKLPFVEDSSNLSSKYTRNYLRNEWIPAIEKIYPQVKENIAANIERFSSIEKLYDQATGKLLSRLRQQKGEELHIPIRLLLKFNNRSIFYELFSPYGFTEKQMEEVVKLAKAGTGRYMDSPDGQWRLLNHRQWFIVSPVRSKSSENRIIVEGEREIIFGKGRLQLEEQKAEISTDKNTACLSAAELSFPLLLRKARPGDYFYPFGMKKKKKKIARFQIDLKLSRNEKENTWVLESEGRIAWVVGQRIDERFKLKPSDKEMLKISFQHG